MKDEIKTKYENSIQQPVHSKKLSKRMKLFSLITLTAVLYLTSGKVVNASFHAASNNGVQSLTQSAAAITTTNAAIGTDLKNTKELTEAQANELAKDAFEKYFKIDTGKLSVISSREIESLTDPGAFTWNLSYSTNIKNFGISLLISIDSISGRICSMSKYSPVVTAKAISEETAKTNALKYVSQLLPEAPGSITEAKSLKKVIFKNNVYAFIVYRLVNGIIYNGNYVQISVNKYTGELVDYASVWDENISAPTPDSMIDKAKADKLIEDHADFYPAYFVQNGNNFGESQTNSKRIIYKYDNDTQGIVDAKTGELLSASDKFCNKYSIDLDGSGRKELLNHTSSPKGSKQLNMNEARKVILGDLKQIAPALTIKSLVFVDYYGTKGSAWRAELTQKGKTEKGFLAINARTGTLLYFRPDDGIRDVIKVSQVKTGFEEGYKRSINLLENIYPDKLKSIITKQRYYDSRGKVNDEIYTVPFYNYNFARTENGIAVESDRIQIRIDKQTGEILEVNYDFEDGRDFSGSKNMINEESVKKIFFSNFPNSLNYISIIKKEADGSSHKEIRLVYMNQYWKNIDFYAIDASKGSLLDIDGRIIKTNTGS